MAQRRMFSLKIIDTDLFLDMPTSTQLLYFHLSLRADDDGFISSPKKIMKMVGCSDDDMKILIAKQFVIPFESGICVIKHWRIHNYIQKDRYNETMYKIEKSTLADDNGTYEKMDTERIQDGYISDTQVRLGKVRLELGKDRLLLDEKISSTDDCCNELQPIIEAWNNLNLSKVVNIKNNRLKLLKVRIKEYGIDSVIQAIESIKKSNFLKGQNKNNWIITFDWFIKPNNFIKVLEGNYTDKEDENVLPGRNDEKNIKYKGVDFSRYEV